MHVVDDKVDENNYGQILSNGKQNDQHGDCSKKAVKKESSKGWNKMAATND